MKSKILTFIIGVLVGAIITTLGFLIFQKVNHKNMDIRMDEMRHDMENRGDLSNNSGDMRHNNSQGDNKEKTRPGNFDKQQEEKQNNQNSKPDETNNQNQEIQNKDKKQEEPSNNNM